MRKFALLCGVAGLLLSTAASYADAGIQTGFDAGIYGNYMWRGQKRGPVGIVANAYATKTFWNHFSVTGRVFNYTMLAGGRGIAEGHYDGSLGYDPGWKSGWLKNTQFQLGYIYYDRNNNPASPAFHGDDAQEIYAGVKWPGRLWSWSPYITGYYQFQKADHTWPGSPAGTMNGYLNDRIGFYLEAGVGNSWKLGNSGWTFDGAGKIGLDFGHYAAPLKLDTFRDAAIHTGFRYQLEKGLELSPAVDWWIPSHQTYPSAHMLKPVLSLSVMYNRTY